MYGNNKDNFVFNNELWLSDTRALIIILPFSGQHYYNPTARSAHAQDRLRTSANEAARVLNGTDKNVKRQALRSVSKHKIQST